MRTKQELIEYIASQKSEQAAPISEIKAPQSTTDLSDILARIQTLGDENEMLTKRMTKFEAMSEQFERLNSRLTMLEGRVPPVLEGGRLPANLSELECQIFHTPLAMIPPAQRRIKTEWSLRLTAYVDDKRMKPDINVKLYNGRRFYQQVMEISDHPEFIEQTAERNQDTGGLGGMLLAITKQKGRPYIPSQFCMLSGHCDEKPKVAVMIDDRVIEFVAFRPGNGIKENRAKWYAKMRL